jgi:hypothetical protein
MVCPNINRAATAQPIRYTTSVAPPEQLFAKRQALLTKNLTSQGFEMERADEFPSESVALAGRSRVDVL